MSYNIRIGIGMDGETDLGRIADAINRITPDYVGLQEVDSCLLYTSDAADE